MNLHGIASAAIGAVNPHRPAILRCNIGYTTSPDGRQVPRYDSAVPVVVQVQAFTYKDLTQVDGLNIQGEARAVYIGGKLHGVLRLDSRGGDLLTFDGQEWLVKQVLEQWPDYTKAVIVRQS